MGVDAEDVDGDGDLDLIVSNFTNEYNTLHMNLGNAMFNDVTPMIGLAGRHHAVRRLGPGRWPTSTTTAGPTASSPTATSTTTASRPARPSEYAEPALLHRNVARKTGKGRRFQLSTLGVGPYFDTKHVGRGAAFGDFDDDGDIDIAINHKDGQAALLRNDTPSGRQPLGPPPARRHQEQQGRRRSQGQVVDLDGRHRPPAQGGLQRPLEQRPPPDHRPRQRPRDQEAHHQVALRGRDDARERQDQPGPPDRRGGVVAFGSGQFSELVR